MVLIKGGIIRIPSKRINHVRIYEYIIETWNHG